jgi:hypothetical protein
LGIVSGFDVWHLGMTPNGSGAHQGCLGYELSAGGAGVDLARRSAGLMSSLSNPAGL